MLLFHNSFRFGLPPDHILERVHEYFGSNYFRRVQRSLAPTYVFQFRFSHLHQIVNCIPHNAPKHRMLVLEFPRLPQREEELTPIIILSSAIRHTQQPPTIELEPAVKFILKNSPGINRFASMPGAGRVATLNDEGWNKTMEDCISVITVETMLKERAGGDWGLFGEEL